MSRRPDGPSSRLTFRRLPALSSVTLFAAVLTVGLPAVAWTQEVDDTTAIHSRVEEYLKAWNAHDSTALAALFTEDADVVMGNLPAAQGREQIRDQWREYFARQEPERRLTLDVGPLRLIAADVAVLNVETTTGGIDPEGPELTARTFRGTWLWQRRGGDWLIAAMRGLPREEHRVVLNASLEAADALRPGIRGFVAAYEDALNTHDPAAVSGFYADDAEIIVRNSPRVQGREAIQDWWRSYFSEPRPYRAILVIDEIRTIAPDVALIDITATGAVSQAAGRRLPVRYARATWVIVRDADEWLISALWVLPSEEDGIVRESGGQQQRSTPPGDPNALGEESLSAWSSSNGDHWTKRGRQK